MRLWAKVASASTFLVLMTVVTVGGLLFWAEKRQLLVSQLGQQKESVERFAQVCVESSAEQNDIILINYVHSLSQVPGFKYAYFADSEGKFRAHSDPAQIGFAAPDFARNEFRGGIDEVIFPVNYQGRRIGIAGIGYDKIYFTNQIDLSMQTALIRLFYISSLVGFVGILGSFIFARGVTKPLAALTQGTQMIGKGELGYRLPVHGRDEIGILGRAFNDMAQKLQELDELKSDFVSSVSHELRSPLTALKGFLQMFQMGLAGPLTDPQKENINLMLQCTDRLGKFVNDILDVAKLEAGMMDFTLMPVDPRAVAQEMVAFYQPQGQAEKIQVLLESPAAVPAVTADSDKIKQVLTNLINNAFKFTPEGGRIRVWVRDEGKAVRFGVTDSGVGIPKDEIGKLFNKFEQVKSTKGKAKSKGTGLGLAICKQIVEAMGGKIAVESDPGKGTTFHFYLAKASLKAAA